MEKVVEDSEEVCLNCVQMKKTFVFITISAVVPILVFAGLLLLVTAKNLDTEFETTTTVVVEFVFGLLYVQHFVATAFLILSFAKRRRPVLKYHMWYMVFHVAIIWLLICSCVALTIVNQAYIFTGLVVVGGMTYFALLYRCMTMTKKYPWIALRRAF